MLTIQPVITAALLVIGYFVATLWWLWPRKLPSAAVLVAYASEGGNAANLARLLFQQLVEEGQQATLLTLNQLKTNQLLTAEKLLIITSTHGEGEAPENGRLFEKELAKLTAHLDTLKYAVLALGDSHYQLFCGFGLRLDERLKNIGAQPLFATVSVDKLNRMVLQQWQQQLVSSGVLAATSSSEHCLVEQEVHQATLLKRTWLNPHSPGLPMYELEFETSCLPTWQAGDIAKLQLADVEREYTIASLPTEKVLRLLVRQQHSPAGQLGLGSGFLTEQLPLNQAARFALRTNPDFHAPAANVPMILIGNGTGLSGLRAHLKEREQQGYQQNWLIYGERSPEHDLPWQQELQAWQRSGHLTQLDLTFSRVENCQWPTIEDGGHCRCYQGYVQQVLVSQGQQLQSWLAQGAVIYLCGSKQGMAQDVEQELLRLLGEPKLTQLIEQNRYRRDVY